jgi:hypothetical protein
MADSLTDLVVPDQPAIQVEEAGLAAPGGEVEAVLVEAEEVGAEAVEEAADGEGRGIKTGVAHSTGNSPISGIGAARSSLPIRDRHSSHLRIPR